MSRRLPSQFILLASACFAAGTLLTIVLAYHEHRAPARCPPGQVERGARCCGEGQRLLGRQCVGVPTACGPHLVRLLGTVPGCVAKTTRVLIPAARLVVGPIDWEAQGIVERRDIAVDAFFLDAAEVTHQRWASCSASGACPKLPSGEPGRPVTDIAPEDAIHFCNFAGGRLPTGDEWMLAAVGPHSHRYPWGNSGLVCRRAVFGLAAGPCAWGGDSPEIAGNRPDGASSLGILDLAGNVAELTTEGTGSFVARGGSYLSRRAAELKGWAFEMADGPRKHIGFRCAYERDSSDAPVPRHSTGAKPPTLCRVEATPSALKAHTP